MKVNISGHHTEISQSAKEHVEQKLAKLASHFPSLISVDCIITKEHGAYQAELITNYEGTRIATSGTDKVMYPAISKATKKLDAALMHRKGQLKGDLHKKPETDAPEIAVDIIQAMELN